MVSCAKITTVYADCCMFSMTTMSASSTACIGCLISWHVCLPYEGLTFSRDQVISQLVCPSRCILRWARRLAGRGTLTTTCLARLAMTWRRLLCSLLDQLGRQLERATFLHRELGSWGLIVRGDTTASLEGVPVQRRNIHKTGNEGKCLNQELLSIAAVALHV